MPARYAMDGLHKLLLPFLRAFVTSPQNIQVTMLAITSCTSLLTVFPHPHLFDIFKSCAFLSRIWSQNTVYLHTTWNVYRFWSVCSREPIACTLPDAYHPTGIFSSAVLYTSFITQFFSAQEALSLNCRWCGYVILGVLRCNDMYVFHTIWEKYESLSVTYKQLAVALFSLSTHYHSVPNNLSALSAVCKQTEVE
jgi:hypothetical protein